MLGITKKKVKDVMTLWSDVFMLGLDDTLDQARLISVLKAGHSRVPVFDGERNNIRAILLVKHLIIVNPEHKLTVRALMATSHRAVRDPIFVSPDTGQSEHLHLLLISVAHLCDG